MLGPAAHTLIAFITYLGGPLMGITENRPDPETITPAVNISIADGNTESVAKGQIIRYQIKVSNNTELDSPVTIRLTVPPGVFSDLTADQAAVVANAAAWRMTLAAGETRVIELGGTIDSRADRYNLAATACVNNSAGVLSCATDLNLVDEDRMRSYAWIAAIFLGFLAVALSVWLQRIVRPEFLTPANAGAAFGDQP